MYVDFGLFLELKKFVSVSSDNWVYFTQFCDLNRIISRFSLILPGIFNNILVNFSHTTEYQNLRPTTPRCTTRMIDHEVSLIQL